MNTSQSSPEVLILETRYVWARTMPAAMEYAMKLKVLGWDIQGNPAPMFYNDTYGTGVAITRMKNEHD